MIIYDMVILLRINKITLEEKIHIGQNLAEILTGNCLFFCFFLISFNLCYNVV